jgi:flagellin-specific chaperone FliS
MADTPPTLDEQLKQLEIEKLRAELAQAQSPQRFFERNWQGLVTAFAAILAACGGLAALVTAASQTFDLWNHIGQQQELVTYQQKENDADKAAVDADKREIAAEKAYMAANKQLDDASAKLGQAQSQFEELESQLHRERATVIPDWIKKLQDERTAQQLQIADLQKQLAALPKSAAAQAQLQKLALALKVSAAPGPRHGLVYVQYANPSSLDAMQGLQAELSKDGYSVPGIEKVSTSLLNPAQNDEVRYFKQTDKDRALQVAAIANTYLKTACPQHGAIIPRLHYIANSAPNAPMELWAGFGCPPVKS